MLTSTNVTGDERKEYEIVVAKFDAFFKIRRNIIFERARFNRRNHAEGESSEQYIMELYKLAENCEYGEMQAEMIRDRLVVGIRDSTLSQKLQLNPKLTLELEKTMICQREAVGEQQKQLKGVQESAGSLEGVRTQRGGRFNKKHPRTHWKLNPKAATQTPTATPFQALHTLRERPAYARQMSR